MSSVSLYLPYIYLAELSYSRQKTDTSFKRSCLVPHIHHLLITYLHGRFPEHARPPPTTLLSSWAILDSFRVYLIYTQRYDMTCRDGVTGHVDPAILIICMSMPASY